MLTECRSHDPRVASTATDTYYNSIQRCFPLQALAKLFSFTRVMEMFCSDISITAAHSLRFIITSSSKITTTRWAVIPVSDRAPRYMLNEGTLCGRSFSSFLLRRKAAHHDITHMYGNEADDSQDCDSWLVHSEISSFTRVVTDPCHCLSFLGHIMEI